MAARIPRFAYPIIERIGPVVLRLLMHTARLSAEWAPGAKGALGKGVNCIHVFWHGTMIVPAYLCRDLGIRIMISMARDGEYVARVIRRMGFETVRGSSSRGAISALEAMAREARRGAGVAITPDGPRGPRHSFQPGAIYLAQLSGAPIVPTAVAIRRAWKMRSWDRFEVPKPLSRIHAVIGDPVWVDRDLPRDRVPALVQRLEEMMLALDRQAAQFLDMKTDEEKAAQ